MNYRPRIADKLLENKLKSMGAVLVEGAKWCGKTTTSEQHARSVLYMDNPKDRTYNIQMVQINPNLLLNGATPRLIDEWQIGGDSLIEEGVKSLQRLENKIDTTKMKKPSFLMVLTAIGKFAYRRKDGVWVVPIGCLKD